MTSSRIRRREHEKAWKEQYDRTIQLIQLCISGSTLLLMCIGLYLNAYQNSKTTSPVFHERVHTEDDSGNAADVDVYILRDDFTWILGKPPSSNEALRNLNAVERESVFENASMSDLVAALDTPAVRKLLNEANYIVCVGTASNKGEESNEEDRARIRGELLAQLVSRLVDDPRKTTVKAANAGQFTKVTRISEPVQRRVVILGVVAHSSRLNLTQALKNGLLRLNGRDHTSVASSLLKDYSVPVESWFY